MTRPRPMERWESNRRQALDLTATIVGPWCVRYGFYPSMECALNGGESQDYLSFRVTRSRCAFVVTDGVGQSFFGDIAAHRVGEALLAWALSVNLAESTEARLGAGLNAMLERRRKVVEQAVAGFALPPNLGRLQSAALEQQRQYGSDAMLGVGIAQRTGRRDQTAVFIAVLGDVRIGVQSDGERIRICGASACRWSSRRGMVGSMETVYRVVDGPVRLHGYSDGLASLDAESEVPTSGSLRRSVSAAQSSGASDDIAFFDATLGSAGVERDHVLDTRPAIEVVDRGRLLGWNAVDGATHYLVQTTDGGEWLVRGNRWRVRRTGGEVIVRAAAVRLGPPSVPVTVAAEATTAEQSPSLLPAPDAKEETSRSWLDWRIPASHVLGIVALAVLLSTAATAVAFRPIASAGPGSSPPVYTTPPASLVPPSGPGLPGAIPTPICPPESSPVPASFTRTDATCAG